MSVGMLVDGLVELRGGVEAALHRGPQLVQEVIPPHAAVTFKDFRFRSIGVPDRKALR